MFEVPPKPPPPPPAPEPPKPEPVKEAPKPKPVVKIAKATPPPEPPKEMAPPPPNDAPPPEPPKTPVPLQVGISMSSTTSAGSFAAPVGNTTYGKLPEKAPVAAEVKAYSAPKYTPVYQVDSEPEALAEVKPPYPEDARRNNIEGSVTMAITIDHNGNVVNVRVINGPGYGLNEAARDAMRRVKFKPAVKGGEAVSTEIKYTYTFLLD
jgi:protein TonB